jgi:hypothetical protein
MNTMFTYIEQSEPVWKDISNVSNVDIFGEAKCEGTPEPISVSMPATIEAFKNNYEQYLPIYKSVLEPQIQEKIEKLKLLEIADVDFPSDTWVKTVYSFIAKFHTHP